MVRGNLEGANPLLSSSNCITYLYKCKIQHIYIALFLLTSFNTVFTLIFKNNGNKK